MLRQSQDARTRTPSDNDSFSAGYNPNLNEDEAKK